LRLHEVVLFLLCYLLIHSRILCHPRKEESHAPDGLAGLHGATTKSVVVESEIAHNVYCPVISSMTTGLALPEQVIPQFLRVGAEGGDFGKGVPKHLVGVRLFMLLE
jgi:hypothetical protein